MFLVQGNGAYTGECSADQIVDIGCKWVILGHSERRQYFKEDNEILRTKLGELSACIGVFLPHVYVSLVLLVPQHDFHMRVCFIIPL